MKPSSRYESISFFEQRMKRRSIVQKTKTRKKDCVDSFVGKSHEYVVCARILWFEYANTAWKLRIVCRKTARSSYMFLCGIADTNKIVAPERQVYQDLLSALRGFARTTSHQYRTPGYIRPFVGPTGFPDFGRGVDKPGWPVAMATLWIDPSKYHLRRRPKESPDFRE